MAWNKDTFANIFQRKKRCQLHLEGVQLALARRTTSGLLRLEEKLRNERNEVLMQEELLWRQKSRIEWIKVGDKNTCFFYTIALVRRRRNRVEALMDDQERWVLNKAELNELALNFYLTLFLAEPISGGGSFYQGGFPTISDDQRTELGSKYSMDETWKALKDMGLHKAPGPDGFQACFFYST